MAFAVGWAVALLTAAGAPDAGFATEDARSSTERVGPQLSGAGGVLQRSPAGTSTVPPPSVVSGDPGPLATTDPDGPTGRVVLGILLGALVWALGRGAARARRWLRPTGFLPRTLAILAGAAGVGAVALVIWGAIAVFPTVSPEIRWAMLFSTVVLVLVAARGVIPDVFALFVLLGERRIRPGLRVDGPRFAGTVMRIGWRSTGLRTPRGMLDVPNRAFLAAPVRISGAAEHELVLHLNDLRSAKEIRRRIEDAVLASAWTPPSPQVRVHRDPKDATRWIVHSRLLDPRYAPAFDADLLERLEAVLAAELPRADDAPASAER